MSLPEAEGSRCPFNPPIVFSARSHSTTWIVGMLLALAACSPPNDAGRRDEPSHVEAAEVEVAKIERMELTRRLRVTGSLHGSQEITIAAETSGRVVAIARDLGDRVQSDELLLQIDGADYQLALLERERAFQQSLAAIGIDSLPVGDFDVESLPAVERARLEAVNARAKLERARVMIADTPPLMSQQEFEDVSTAADIAASALRLARLGSEAKIAEARTLDAQVEIARKRLADTTIKVPLLPDTDRTRSRVEVAMRHVDVGDFVQMGTPLFELVAVDPLVFRTRVPQRRSSEVTMGAKVSLLGEDGAEVAAGTVSRIAPAVDPTTRTFLVEIRVDNPSRRLRPGAFAVGDIETSKSSVLTVPRRAVATFAGVDKLFLVSDGAVTERRVELGDESMDRIEVKTEVPEGAVIVVDPPGTLSNGTPVRIVDATSRPAEQEGEGRRAETR